MKKYELIAFDMDGTLLNSKKEIDKSSLDAIKYATEKGKIVILSTGRCPSQLQMYVNDIPNLRYLNCLSGAIVYDLKEQKYIYTKTMPFETVKTLMDITKGHDVMIELLYKDTFVQKNQCDVIEEYGMGIYKEQYKKWAVLMDNLIEEFLKAPFEVGKVNFYTRTPEERNLIFKKIIDANLEVETAYAETTSIEISSKNTDKSVGLEKLCEHLNISIKDTIAVGDADNDIGIFKKAGLKIAMGNANKNIKALADVIVNDCDNGGCSQAVYNYLLAEKELAL